MKYLGLIGIILLCSCGVFTDPGGNLKYEVDVSTVVNDKNNIPNQDDVSFFNDSILVQVSERLLTYSDDVACRKNSDGNKVCSKNKFLSDYSINYKYHDSKQIIFFASFLYAFKDDSDTSNIYSPILISKAIYFDQIIKKAKIIETIESGSFYSANKLPANIVEDKNNILRYSIVSNMQHVLVDYGYFSNRKKVKNGEVRFWNNIKKKYSQ